MPASDLDLLTDAAEAAGEIALRYFQRDPQVWDKGGGAGPVTAADLAVNEMLLDRLTSGREDYGWLSEETEDTGARAGASRLFVIDPIDGTRAFIDGSKDWSHALAVVEDGAVTAAAVHLPARDLMFAAARGQGAWLNGTRLAGPPHRAVDTARVLSARPNFDGRFWQGGTPPPVKRAFRSSLAYRLCLVAEGNFDAMLTLRPSWEWDIAAGSLIVAEAGASATDQTGQALRFNNPHPQVPGVLAGGPIHRVLLDALAV